MNINADPEQAGVTDRALWQEYLATARSLDTVCRELASAGTVAGMVDDPAGPDAPTAAGAGGTSTTELRAEWQRTQGRLRRQRARITGAAARAGYPAPRLRPDPAEQAAGFAVAATDPVSALRRCRDLLDRGDRTLTGASRRGRASSGRRPPASVLAALAAAAILACLTLLALTLG